MSLPEYALAFLSTLYILCGRVNSVRFARLIKRIAPLRLINEIRRVDEITLPVNGMLNRERKKMVESARNMECVFRIRIY